jgi:hypothetical protein
MIAGRLQTGNVVIASDARGGTLLDITLTV